MLKIGYRHCGREGITAEQETELVALAQAGDRGAMDRLLRAHWRMLKSIAWKEAVEGIEVDDLVSEGAIGFMTAVEKFDGRLARSGLPQRLSTFTRLYAVGSMRRLINQTRSAVRPSTASLVDYTLVCRARRDLQRKLRRPASDEEIAERLGYALSRVRNAIRAARSDVPLDAPIGESDGTPTTRADLLRDESPLPDEVAEELIDGERDRALIAAAMGVLNERERAVIYDRYLSEGASRKAGAAAIGTSKQYSDIIQHRAFRKMRRYIARGRGEPVTEEETEAA